MVCTGDSLAYSYILNQVFVGPKSSLGAVVDLVRLNSRKLLAIFKWRVLLPEPFWSITYYKFKYNGLLAF